MADDLTPIEERLRQGEVLDPAASLVLRGSPLTIDGVLANAERTRLRFTFGGWPLIAISVDVTIAGWMSMRSSLDASTVGVATR